MFSYWALTNQNADIVEKQMTPQSFLKHWYFRLQRYFGYLGVWRIYYGDCLSAWGSFHPSGIVTEDTDGDGNLSLEEFMATMQLVGKAVKRCVFGEQHILVLV